MNIYIWQSVDELTTSYHSDGGCVVVAPSLDRARELLTEPYCDGIMHDTHSDREQCHLVARDKCEALRTEPDYIYPTSDEAEATVIVFPNTGCC